MPPLRFLHLHFEVLIFGCPPGFTPAFRLQPVHKIVAVKIQISKIIRFELRYFWQPSFNISMTIIL